jgi:hypothetical protein
MLSGVFGVLVDLVADYVRRSVVAAPPYLYNLASPMRALFDLDSNCSNV